MTRDDIRADRLACYGFSWGAEIGSMALALERRFVTGVLLDDGIEGPRTRPEVQRQRFAARVEVSILMANGEYDLEYSLAGSQRLCFAFSQPLRGTRSA